MKIYTSLFSAFAIILCLSVASFAQKDKDKDKVEGLPAGATLQQSGAWLTETIDKNFGYNLIDDSVKIGDLKIEGCKVSYRIFQMYMDSKAPLGDRPALGRTGAAGGSDLRYTTFEDVSFDLKDINASAVAMGPLPQPKKMQLISLETTGKKELIRFVRKGSKDRFNADGSRALTAFPVKEKAGEAIARAFIYTIQLCQGATQ